MTWIMSALTIYSLWLAGDRRGRAWVVGLLNQALWLVYIFAREEWGLLPMNAALWVVYARNLRKWSLADGGSLNGPSRLGASPEHRIQGAKSASNTPGGDVDG